MSINLIYSIIFLSLIYCIIFSLPSHLLHVYLSLSLSWNLITCIELLDFVLLLSIFNFNQMEREREREEKRKSEPKIRLTLR